MKITHYTKTEADTTDRAAMVPLLCQIASTHFRRYSLPFPIMPTFVRLRATGDIGIIYGIAPEGSWADNESPLYWHVGLFNEYGSYSIKMLTSEDFYISESNDKPASQPEATDDADLDDEEGDEAARLRHNAHLAAETRIYRSEAL